MTTKRVLNSLLIVFSMVTATVVFVMALWTAASPYGSYAAGLLLAFCAVTLGVVSLKVGMDVWQLHPRSPRPRPEHPVNQPVASSSKRGPAAPRERRVREHPPRHKRPPKSANNHRRGPGKATRSHAVR
jgi:hypothetical protein